MYTHTSHSVYNSCHVCDFDSAVKLDFAALRMIGFRALIVEWSFYLLVDDYVSGALNNMGLELDQF